MKAKYIGLAEGDEDAPRRVSFGGKVFRRGQFVDISKLGDDKSREVLQGKLRTNPGFAVSDEALTAEELEAAADEAEVVEAPAKSAPGKAKTKAELIADLEALADKHPGKVEFDPKAKVGELASKLEELQFELGE